MSERILVTGDSGFVGDSIKNGLRKLKYPVTGTSRSGEIKADLTAPQFVEQMKAAVEPCAVIIHAAACLDKNLLTADISNVNCLGMQHILELREAWNSYLIFISGVTVIGKPQQHPISEEHPVNPQTAYHASKYFGELLVNVAIQGGAKAVNLRITSPVGEGMPQNRIMPFFVKSALAGAPITLLGKGTRVQNYIDMRDLVCALEKCLRLKPSGLFNIASGENISNFDLARLCVDTFSSKSEIIFSGKDDPEEGQCWDVSIEKAQTMLGYSPACKVVDSLQAIKDGYAAADSE